MKPLKVSISTPNKMFFIKGKLIRSPLTTIVKYTKDFLLLKTSLKKQDVKYTIEEVVENEIVEKLVILEEEQITIAKLKKKSTPKSTLEKIAAEIE